jgi:hypothetical protein
MTALEAGVLRLRELEAEVVRLRGCVQQMIDSCPRCGGSGEVRMRLLGSGEWSQIEPCELCAAWREALR